MKLKKKDMWKNLIKNTQDKHVERVHLRGTQMMSIGKKWKLAMVISF